MLTNRLPFSVCICVCVGSRQPQFRPIQVDESRKHQTRLSRRFFGPKCVMLLQLPKRRGNRIIPPLSLVKTTASLYKKCYTIEENQTRATKAIRRTKHAFHPSKNYCSKERERARTIIITTNTLVVLKSGSLTIPPSHLLTQVYYILHVYFGSLLMYMNVINK